MPLFFWDNSVEIIGWFDFIAYNFKSYYLFHIWWGMWTLETYYLYFNVKYINVLFILFYF